MEILLPLAYAALFSFLVYRMNYFGTFGLKRRNIVFLFLIKCAAGVVLWAIYTFYYTQRSEADIYKYFDDSQVMYDALFTHPGDYFRMVFMLDDDEAYFRQYYSNMNHWYGEFNTPFFNDAHTIIRMNAIARLFSFGNFHVHTVFWCIMSLIGLLYLFRTFARCIPDMRKELAFCIFLLPSVLLWSSGVLKEGPLFLALGIFIHSYFRIWEKIYTLKYSIQILLSVYLLCAVKFYILFCLLPGICADIWVRLSSEKRIGLKYAASYAVLIALSVVFSWKYPDLNPLPKLVFKQINFINLAEGGAYLQKGEAWIYVEDKDRSALIPAGADSLFTLRKGSAYYYWPGEDIRDSVRVNNSSDTSTYKLLYDFKPSGSKINIARLQPDVWSFVKNSPAALFNALFRPHPLEAKSPLLLLSMLENLLLLLFIVLVIVFFKKNPANQKLLYFCLSFSLVLAILIGLTTPVLGAIVRYKAPALPFLFISLLLLIDKEKLVSKIPFLRRFTK